MFENNNPLPNQNPLNPVMPAPGMPSSQGPAPAAPQPFAPPAPQVHSMPERFRNTGASSGGSSGGSSKTKKLLITLIIVIVIAGLGVVGLFIFNKVVKSNTNNANTTNTTNTITNNANRNVNLNTNTSANLNGNVSNINSLGNLNTNTSANVNSAVNGNTNAVTNTTSNVNSTANTNSVTNTSTNTNASVSTIKLPSNTDTDSDGLTDTEELVYGTSPTKADTDGDGYIDGMKVQANGTIIGEIYKLYDPTNPDPNGKLEGSTLVRRIQNSVATFSLLIPTKWNYNESSGLMVITPDTTTGELFQIRTYDNASLLSAQNWYATTFPQGLVSQTTSITLNGLEGIVSPDGTSVYLFKDGKVYGFTYTTASLSKVNFWTTFEMMKNSFRLVAA